MPLYEYECLRHGKFEEFQSMMAEHRANCPECGGIAQRIFSLPATIRMKEKEQLQFGTKAPSQLVPSKVEGGHPSYILSEGMLEQEEIDHIALVQEERDIAQSKREKSATSKAIGNIITTVTKEKRGNRFSAMKKIKAEGM